MIDIQDIQSLTDFQRNTRKNVARLKKTGRPGILTVNGHAELVVQAADAYRDLIAKAEQVDFLKKLRRGIEDCEAGRGRDVDEVFDELDRKYFGKPLRKKSSR